MTNIKKIIGSRIKSERVKRKMSTEDLAECIGITPSYVGLIERGQRGTNINLLLKFSHIFNISLDEIITYKKRSVMCENKNDDYKSKLLAAESLLRALDEKELNFVMSTIKNLFALRTKSENSDDDNGDDDTGIKEYFY